MENSFVMEIEYIKGDATSPLKNGNKIIVHICNDIGGWGRGFVMAISSKWSEPEQSFRNWYASKDKFALGEVQFVKVEDDIWIANLIGQRDIKGGKDGIPPVRYEAVSTGLSKVASMALQINATVHMPRIGCGLAGGSWDKMEKIIHTQLIDKRIRVTVYDL